MILVPTILPSSAAGAARALRSLSRSGTLAELRIDGLKGVRIGKLLAGPRPPLIVTCRSRKEGGGFDGSARRVTQILMEAVDAGAEYIDVEQRLGAAALRTLFASAGKRRIVLSYHDPNGTPADLAARFRRMASMKPAFVKIAVTARTFSDTGRILGVLAEARKRRQPASAISMGEYGTFTRILQGRFGGTLTYAAHDAARPAAAGQLSTAEMRELYRVGRLNSRTKIFGLLGNPVKFSRGAAFHNGIFARGRKNAVYLNFAADDAGDFLRILGPNITGLSVTMPFKTAIRDHLDRLEGASALTGSVNTVLRKPLGLLGMNTDFHAFLALMNRRTRIAGRRMLVVGTGATAATAAGAGVVSGAGVVIAGRSPRKARALSERFGCAWIPIREHASADAEIIVNTTPVGMNPGPGRLREERIVSLPALRGARVVCDFANPLSGPTRLVRDARRMGCAVVDGAAIFALQAKMQSTLFLELV